jgi:hypothetical protein
MRYIIMMAAFWTNYMFGTLAAVIGYKHMCSLMEFLSKKNTVFHNHAGTAMTPCVPHSETRDWRTCSVCVRQEVTQTEVYVTGI